MYKLFIDNNLLLLEWNLFELKKIFSCFFKSYLPKFNVFTLYFDLRWWVVVCTKMVLHPFTLWVIFFKIVKFPLFHDLCLVVL